MPSPKIEKNAFFEYILKFFIYGSYMQ